MRACSASARCGCPRGPGGTSAAYGHGHRGRSAGARVAPPGLVWPGRPQCAHRSGSRAARVRGGAPCGFGAASSRWCPGWSPRPPGPSWPSTPRQAGGGGRILGPMVVPWARRPACPGDRDLTHLQNEESSPGRSRRSHRPPGGGRARTSGQGGPGGPPREGRLGPGLDAANVSSRASIGAPCWTPEKILGPCAAPALSSAQQGSA